jgi:hypothetical protein
MILRTWKSGRDEIDEIEEEGVDGSVSMCG